MASGASTWSSWWRSAGRQAGAAASPAEPADLDGTAVHEFEGRIAIPDSVSHALKHLNDLGRPVILNTLRFPSNVIRTFGREWYAITNAPLPLVLLNGGNVGYLREDAAENIVYEEIAAFPLEEHEIDRSAGGCARASRERYRRSSPILLLARLGDG